MFFNERIQSLNRERGFLCLGLDPDPEKLPHGLSGINGLYTFCSEIVAACADSVVAIKPNLAFFEQFGFEGWQVLARLREQKPEHVLWILDAKRGDIGNTSKSYARALFDNLGADAITVSPYLGADSVQPFLTNPEKGVFLLALTSNPGSNDFQYYGEPPLWQTVIKKSSTWDTQNLGYVIGATRIEQLSQARELAGTRPFLIPGIGAQGGSLEAAIGDGLGNGKFPGVINISRAILYVSNSSDFAEKAAEAAQDWNRKIAHVITTTR
ncbi:MAG: orotidine-5'-phosphate decarboxylase [bacterium]|nr:orotidine-5'-phosphate decarboxylase [bacterium]